MTLFSIRYIKRGLSIMKRCNTCNSIFPDSDRYCPNCRKFTNQKFTIENNQYNGLSCPSCHSNEVDVISGTKKGFSALLFGFFGTNTVINRYRCNKCGHKF